MSVKSCSAFMKCDVSENMTYSFERKKNLPLRVLFYNLTRLNKNLLVRSSFVMEQQSDTKNIIDDYTLLLTCLELIVKLS